MFSDFNELASIIGGSFHENFSFNSNPVFKIDSRAVSQGGVFIAMKGERTDGHRYVDDALSRGATCVIVSDEEIYRSHKQCIFVKDTLKALGNLAAHKRRLFMGRVIGITGSNGKTIVKDALVRILSRDFKVSGNTGSYNSRLGVPLAMLSYSDDADFWICEAGISSPGDMEILEGIIKPDIGILTNIGLAHIGSFKDRRELYEEKMMLFKNSTGWLLLPDTEPLVKESEFKTKVYYSGITNGDLPYLKTKTLVEGALLVEVKFPSGNLRPLRLTTPSSDIAMDIEIAIEAAWLSGMDEATVIKAAGNLGGGSTRQEIWQSPDGITIINDACSSDPISVESALRTMDLLSDREGKKIFVFAGMTELGEMNESVHRQIGLACALHGVTHLFIQDLKELDITIQTYLNHHEEGLVTKFTDLLTVKTELIRLLDSRDIILFKGPRKANISKVAEYVFEAIAPNRLITDLGAVFENINIFKKLTGKETKILAMVKALAYGSEMIRIARELEAMGVDMLGVSTPDEGARLRQQTSMPVLVMVASPEEAFKIVRHNLIPVVWNIELAKALENELGPEQIGHIHIKVDTGMGRMGLLPSEIPNFLEELKQLKKIRISGLMTHFSCADDPSMDDHTLRQIQSFNEVYDFMLKNGHSDLVRHASATSGIIRFPNAHYDMVRVGLGLYGLYPSANLMNDVSLQLAVTLVSRLIAIRTLPVGTKIGYGATFEVKNREIRAGVIPIGYHDGISWRLGGKGTFFIHGKRAPILGRVSMDSILVDVSNIEGVSCGDEVLIYGVQDGFMRRPEDLADDAGTIVYEVLASTGPRVQRIFRGR
ncbi:alanine racemase [Myxococcota bacterium]|nr:alanine racemase [Myxococcota bacterium]MBU1381748.1 alanine racemase [Myxococcota bacterium]MBU1496412.1 alanine racemase [Myxococcota bacterium]